MAPVPSRCLAVLALLAALALHGCDESGSEMSVRDDPADQSTLSARVNAVNRKTPEFAGPRATARSAICFSGGGSRALTAGMGQLRALEAIGLLPNGVDAISSVSGGTWAAAEYMYAAGSSEEILGGLVQPSQLTMEFLRGPLSKMGATANASTVDILNEVLDDKTAECGNQSKADGECLFDLAPELWVDVISKAVLGPYSLDGDMYMAASNDAVADIVSRNPALKDVKWAVPRTDRPKTFVMNGVILAPVGYISEGDNVVSFQMSPDYVGSPFFPNGSTSVPYEKSAAIFVDNETDAEHDKMPEEITSTVGGGFVESFAFGGTQPDAAPKEGLVAVGRPKKPFRLADAVGISSAAPAHFLTTFLSLQSLNPQFTYWPIQSGVQSRLFTMGDGGNNENLGLLAMLQSGVSKAVVFANTAVALDPNASATGSVCDFRPTEKGFLGLGGDTTLTDVASRDVTCLFGHCRELTGLHYLNNQVFPEDQLQPLLCELETRVKAGKPAVAKQTLDVLKNDWWGIAGGYKLEVVWFYNERCADFEAMLPDDTKAALAEGEDGPLANFPRFKTNLQNADFTGYTAEQIGLLSAQTQYAVQQNRDMVCSVMGC